MAEDSGNEDSWLYGDSNPEAQENEITNKSLNTEIAEDGDLVNGDVPNTEDTQDQYKYIIPEPEAISAPEQQEEDAAVAADADEDEDEDDEQSRLHIATGQSETAWSHEGGTFNFMALKEGSANGAQLGKQPGKFSIEEFEAVGTINGVAAHEYNLDNLEDKPWRKPGADITDYFNYGFNEDTWRAYCERQKRVRVHESGVGLAQLGNTGGVGRGVIPVAITNDNSKYSGFMGPKKAGPPPGRKMAGTIDVIGVGGLLSRRNNEKGTPPKENVIQVMTADRREYSRKPGFPDMSVPPPGPFELPPPPHVVLPPPGFPPPTAHLEPGYGVPEFYPPEADPYYQAYEPTQDSQWNDPTWQPTPISADVKVVAGGPGPLVTPLPPIIAPSLDNTSSHDSQDAFSSRGSVRARSEEASIHSNAVVKEEGKEKEGKDRKERGDKSERHRERYHGSSEGTADLIATKNVHVAAVQNVALVGTKVVVVALVTAVIGRRSPVAQKGKKAKKKASEQTPVAVSGAVPRLEPQFTGLESLYQSPFLPPLNITSFDSGFDWVVALLAPVVGMVGERYSSPMASLVLTDSSQLTSDSQQLGISRDHWHKRRATGGKRKPLRKKRKFELGRPAANTKLGARRIHTVRTRGGNKKYRALRLDQGNFSWGSEGTTRKSRIIDVVYNASNNELVRTKTLVKNAIVTIDATPFRQWYESHYALPLGRKKGTKLPEGDADILSKKRSKKVEKKYKARQRLAKVETLLEEQFQSSRVLACISSRPGQCGRADGYLLEGKELEFYNRKIKAKKGK
uniref:40S ribosomal protein S8 n=1 Tax=Timema genevievae TaxID=629358 RepID=A0A7R9JP20_TIMGE|nr:unnamed protein product [Timema genevievae]